jgi:hypothetical protein
VNNPEEPYYTRLNPTAIYEAVMSEYRSNWLMWFFSRAWREHAQAEAMDQMKSAMDYNSRVETKLRSAMRDKL